MINFRYHLASLIAVFLALALGVVMGSTVIDRAIVSTLRDRIDSVESNAERRKAENDQLRSDINRLQGSVDQIAPWAVAGRLAGVTVAVVAARGIDPVPVQETVKLMQAAGARTPGILWLESAWDLGSRDDANKIGTALATAERAPKPLRDVGLTTVTNAAHGNGGALFNALVDAGVLRYEAVGDAGKNTTAADWGSPTARLLVVDGPAAKLASSDWTLTVARSATSLRIPTEVAEVYLKTPEAGDRSSRLQPVQSAADLGVVTTVDDLDLVDGRVAAVLGLSDLGRNVVGRYGYGSSATRSVPEFGRS